LILKRGDIVKEVAKWVLMVSLVLALVLGIAAGIGQAWALNEWLVLLLVVLGLVIGILSLGEEEVTGVLVASATVLIAGSANLVTLNTLIPKLGTILSAVMGDVVLIVAPMALVLAIKAVWDFVAEE